MSKRLPKAVDLRVPRTPQHRPKFWYVTTLQDDYPLTYPPTLCITGIWLLEAGFSAGQRVRIDASFGRVVITIAKGDDSDR